MEKKVVIKFNGAFFYDRSFQQISNRRKLPQTKNIYKKPTTGIMLNAEILNTITPKKR